MPKIIFSSKNIASLNIARKLVERHGFEKVHDTLWRRGDIDLVDTEVESIVEVPTDFDTDYILVLSTHKSTKGGRMLTAHFPGNWNEALMGGEKRILNKAYASRLKILMEEMAKANESLGWPLFIEADHHGPVCSAPTIFVEIGSTKEEWGDDDAGSVVASAVSESLNREERYVPVIGIGGGHYAKEFTKMVLENDSAVSHIAPKYAIEYLDTGMIRQAVDKTVEEISEVLVLKDGTNAEQKEKIKRICSELELKYVCKDIKRK